MLIAMHYLLLSLYTVPSWAGFSMTISMTIYNELYCSMQNLELGRT